MAQTYNFNVESSITILQLKQLFLEKTGDDDEDLHAIRFGFHGTILEDDAKTLLGYDIQDGSLLQLDDLSANVHRLFIGAEFADLSNSKGLKKVEWSKTAPRWRMTLPGLCLEGLCTNDKCEANNHHVVMPIGYKRFDILLDTNGTTAICPLCKQYVEPETCSFNNCWWRYEGMKQDEGIKRKPAQKCSSDWQRADNAYHYFDQQISGKVLWKQLIVEAVKNKP